MTLQDEIIAKLLEKVRDEKAEPADIIAPDAGIFCPHQPPGKELWCGVYHNWEDYQQWGEEGHETFCRRHCQYGRNPEVAKRNREIADRKRGRLPFWQRVMPKADPMFHPSVKAAGPPKDYQKPGRGRKVG